MIKLILVNTFDALKTTLWELIRWLPIMFAGAVAIANDDKLLVLAQDQRAVPFVVAAVVVSFVITLFWQPEDEATNDE